MNNYQMIKHYRAATAGETVILFNPFNEECIEIGRQAYDFFCSLKEKDARVRDARLTEEEEGLVTFLLETGFLYES